MIADEHQLRQLARLCDDPAELLPRLTLDTGAWRPWRWQSELIAALPQLKRAQILKARQLGVSWLCAAYALWIACYTPGSLVMLVSQTEADAIILLRKVADLYESLDPALRPTLTRENARSLEWGEIGSEVVALPSTERAGRGRTARLVVADEHAFHAWATANFAALDPTIEAGGQFVILSTADGVGNLFHRLWANAQQRHPPISPLPAEDGEYSFGGSLQDAAASCPRSAWLPIFLPYDICPGRDEVWWAERARDSIPSWLIYQEYPREADEAFVQTGRPVFGSECLAHARSGVCAPMPAEEWPPPLRGFTAPSDLSIWAPPLPGHRYCAGADVAEGLEHGDYSDLCVLDADADGGPAEVLTLHGHWAPDAYARLLDRIARTYPGVYGVERNNHGLAVVLDLRRRGTPGIYQERPVLVRTGDIPPVSHPGWLTTAVSKPLMIDELEAALRHRTITLRDERAIHELTLYSTQPNGRTSAPDGEHDDRVMSRAIAVQMLKRLPPRWRPDDDDEQTGAWSPREW